MTDYDIGVEVTKLKKREGLFQIKAGNDIYRLFFVRNCKINYNDNNVQEDNPGIKPIFTRLTDEVGTFEFVLGNTVDLYGTEIDQSKFWLYTSWQEGIRTTDFVEMDFIRKSVSKSGQIVALVSKLRVRNCGDEYDQNEAIDDITVSGTILDDDSSKALKV